MHVAVGVPQREYGVAVMSRLHLADARFAGVVACRLRVAQCLAVAGEFHDRELAVHVIQDIRVYKCVIQSCIEYFFLAQAAAFHLDSGQVAVPSCYSIGPDLVEIETGLLGFEVHSRVLAAYEGDTDLDHNLLILIDIVISEPEADVVAGNFAGVAGVELVFALVGVPSGLRGHRALFFPIAAA